MATEDLERRFKYHPSTTEAQCTAHETVRYRCYSLAKALDSLLPDGREKALFITNIEQAMMWANAALARQQDAGE